MQHAVQGPHYRRHGAGQLERCPTPFPGRLFLSPDREDAAPIGTTRSARNGLGMGEGLPSRLGVGVVSTRSYARSLPSVFGSASGVEVSVLVMPIQDGLKSRSSWRNLPSPSNRWSYRAPRSTRCARLGLIDPEPIPRVRTGRAGRRIPHQPHCLMHLSVRCLDDRRHA